jgi:SAM-dependent methyltransferase
MSSKAQAAASVETDTFTDAARNHWDVAAAGWNRHEPLLRAWLARATEAMLHLAGVSPGMRVLDVAAGSGDQTLDIAARVGPSGRVLAVDLSPALIELLRANASRAGAQNIDTLAANAETLELEAGSFDAAVSRLGLMLMARPLEALRRMHHALRPRAVACSLVFGRLERNPCISILMQTACRHAGLPPRDPFLPGGLLSLGKPGLMDDLFAQAGYGEVATTSLDAPFRMPSSKAYIQFVREAGSPVQQILSRLSPAAADAAWADMEQAVRQFDTQGGWEGPNELLLTVGRR